MTFDEYRGMENQAIDGVLALLHSGITDDSVSIIMSSDVYDAAKVYQDRGRIERSVVDMRLTCFGKDVYVISQEGINLIFAPVISRFPLEQGPDFESLDAGTFLISESDDGSLCVYSKVLDGSGFFIDTGFTVRKAVQTEHAIVEGYHRQTAAGRSTIFERWLLGKEAKKKREEREKAAAKPDTKELDEFLAGFKVLHPAT